MREWKTVAATALIFTVLAGFPAFSVLAAEKDLGKHSQDEIKKACNAAGGELLGVSDLGSYGCEVASKGTMILCNKSGNCTGYTPARTRSDHNKILDTLKLRTKGTVTTK